MLWNQTKPNHKQDLALINHLMPIPIYTGTKVDMP